jgi:hypothetical protein
MTAALGCAGVTCQFSPRRGGHLKRKKHIMNDEAKLILKDLRHFTGSENCYRHGINRNVTFTGGAKYVADTAGAFWLLDENAIIQPHDQRVATEEFQLWRLTVNVDRTALLACEDGNGCVIYTKHIEYIDFSLDKIEFYFENSVIYLPSER